MEYFDIVDERGIPTGRTVSRQEAHRLGIPHRTAHVWILREREGRREILLQKRSEEKDSFPGLYDTSSAGHIPAGSEPLPSALRELEEELGLRAEASQLKYIGQFRIRYDKVFHGKAFKDNEIAWVYLYREPVDLSALRLQESEVSEVRWFDLETVWTELPHRRDIYCIPTPGLALLREYLGE